MFKNNKILVVIPARGGSKGIPRKNIRLLAGKPLISYAIDMAKASSYVDDVVVSTEDSEISLIAEKFGASVIRRSQDLAGDRIPIDPVIFDATVQKEKQTFDEYDIVITVEPTSPLLKTKTLDSAIEKFESFDVDTVISVFDDRHLSWGYDEKNKKYFPNFDERLNEQYLPKEYVETGGIFATRRGFLTPNSRLGKNVDLIEISKQESINIDDYEDWWIIEHYINNKSIAIVVKADNEVGINHIDRCISIASKLQSKNFKFFLSDSYDLAIKKLNEYNFSFQSYNNLDGLFKLLEEYNPNIIINDIQDTTEEYITKLKNAGYFVVNFEDLGPGFEYADVVFDDLYEHDGGFGNIFTGHKYYILKDEFYFQPHKVINSEVYDVLIFFEGQDSNNLTQRSLDSVLSSGYDGRIDVILDWNYPNKMDFVKKYEDNSNVQIYSDLNKISEFIFKSDIVISSAGKIIYDICSIGVPCICICQNGREQTHRFAAPKNGFINLGLGETVSNNEIASQFEALWKDYELRQNMNNLMLNFDFKNGFENMWAVVEEKYREYQFKR